VARLVLTLVSGAQIEVPTEHDQAMEVVELVRRSWTTDRVGIESVVLGDGQATDWVRLAHISAVSIIPVDEREVADDSTGEASG
jgi:hypothetical protein